MRYGVASVLPQSELSTSGQRDGGRKRCAECYDSRRMNVERLTARYWIETAFPLEQAAEIMAGEQSTGTFVRVPGETDELREAHAARVEETRRTGTVAAAFAARRRRAEGRTPARCIGSAEVTLSWPLANMGAVAAQPAGDRRRQSLRAAVRSPDSSCWTSRCPRRFSTRYQGPQFGVAGTRRLAGVYGRPLIGTIIKPSVGLVAGGDGGTGEHAGARAASISSRTTNCRPTARIARSSSGFAR